jgi:hypothetical protein
MCGEIELFSVSARAGGQLSVLLSGPLRIAWYFVCVQIRGNNYYDDDNDDSTLQLFTFLLNNPKAVYEIITSKRNKQNIREHKGKPKQGNFYHLDNNKNSLQPLRG